jgi:predicted kinase
MELPHSGPLAETVKPSLFVVVTGLPASGKSTTAAALARELRLPLLDKDTYLEALFADESVGQTERRNQLSRQADELLRTEAQRSAGAVLASWWRHPRSRSDSGTPTSWLAALPGVLIEVHCWCRPEVAVARFLARKRHPGHCDASRSEAALLSSFKEQHALGALGFERLVEVDLEQPLEPSTLADLVTARLGRSASRPEAAA